MPNIEKHSVYGTYKYYMLIAKTELILFPYTHEVSIEKNQHNLYVYRQYSSAVI